ncbi:MAG TPA: N-acetyltransferase [Terriglobia bacterium]|nr:N-acetyltransferase [Terriglobia bacterium]
MRLREFRQSDFETLYQIDQACFPPGVSYSRTELAAFIRHPSAATWIAEENNEIVGFLIADREAKGTAHIVTIDVIEGRRRSGVGKALMDAVEAWATRGGLRLIHLETAESNGGAQAFYQARGYRKVETIENYYADGEAAWVMVKSLAKNR